MIEGTANAGDEPVSAGIDYEAAVEDNYGSLFRFAMGLSKNQSDAADLTQETFRILLHKGDQIQDRTKLKTWLFTTLYREFLRRRRRATRFPHNELNETPGELPHVDPRQVRRLDAKLVLEAIQSLEETFRVPVTLFYLEDLSYREISELLGTPIGTVMSRLSRGKEQLRRKLAVVEPPREGRSPLLERVRRLPADLRESTQIPYTAYDWSLNDRTP